MRVLDFPLILSISLLIILWLSVWAGVLLRKTRSFGPGDEDDFHTILTATLTLLSLMIGFTFSMAITRYDLRKDCEDAEANAISNEYIRADLLPPVDAARVRVLLSSYLDQRILFYETRDPEQLRQIAGTTSNLEAALWRAAMVPAAGHPTGVIALAVSGMSEIFDSRGHTEGAWLNRIPISAWILMTIIAVCCNLLIGYGSHHARLRVFLFLVLPFVVSISFYLIAEIDSPRGGIVRVVPQNLASVSGALHMR